jgi:hypothetical protein
MFQQPFFPFVFCIRHVDFVQGRFQPGGLRVTLEISPKRDTGLFRLLWFIL